MGGVVVAESGSQERWRNVLTLSSAETTSSPIGKLSKDGAAISCASEVLSSADSRSRQLTSPPVEAAMNAFSMCLSSAVQ